MDYYISPTQSIWELGLGLDLVDTWDWGLGILDFGMIINSIQLTSGDWVIEEWMITF